MQTIQKEIFFVLNMDPKRDKAMHLQASEVIQKITTFLSFRNQKEGISDTTFTIDTNCS